MQYPSWLEPLKSPAGLTRRLAERGPELVVAVFSLAIAVEAAWLLTRQWPGIPTTKSSTSRPAMGPTAQAPRVNLSAITSAHLFGEAGASAGSDNAPKTALQLVLAGVLATPDPDHGQAILGPAVTSAKLYSTGASIPGGARLKSVYSDRVLLENNGAIEALYLPRTLQNNASLSPVAPSGGQRLQNALQNSNNSLLNGLIRMQPSFDKGKLSGYRVFPGRNGATAFGQLGLKPSDLITAINGTVLDDPNRANEILQTLSSADSAQLTVTRNGQSLDLAVNLAEVATAAEANSTAEPADDATPDGGPGGGPGRLGGGRPGGPGRGPRSPNPGSTDQ